MNDKPKEKEEPKPPKWPPDVPMPKVENPDPPPGEPDPITGRPATEQEPAKPGEVSPAEPPQQAAQHEDDHHEDDHSDSDDPDEVEEEIDEAVDNGDVVEKHKPKTTSHKSSSKKKSKR